MLATSYPDTKTIPFVDQMTGIKARRTKVRRARSAGDDGNAMPFKLAPRAGIAQVGKLALPVGHIQFEI